MLHMCIHPNIMPTHLSRFLLSSLTYNFQTIGYVDQYLDMGFPWKEAPLKDEGQVKVISGSLHNSREKNVLFPIDLGGPSHY